MSMIIDRQARTTNPVFISNSLDPRDPSGALHEDLHLLTDDLEESLAASDGAVSPRYKPLPGREKKMSDRIFLKEWFTTSDEAVAWQYKLIPDEKPESPDKIFYKESFPISDEAVALQKEVRHVHEWFFVSATAGQELINEREQTRLAHKLHTAFETEPLEDGMHHKAEVIIEQALRSGGDQRILGWLREFSLDDTQPVFAASVLRCLGRQEYLGTSSWRSVLVRDALALDDVEIRDAAVQAAELWGDRDILSVLKSHSEPEPWLQDYISDVIDDLGE